MWVQRHREGYELESYAAVDTAEVVGCGGGASGARMDEVAGAAAVRVYDEAAVLAANGGGEGA